MRRFFLTVFLMVSCFGATIQSAEAATYNQTLEIMDTALSEYETCHNKYGKIKSACREQDFLDDPIVVIFLTILTGVTILLVYSFLFNFILAVLWLKGVLEKMIFINTLGVALFALFTFIFWESSPWTVMFAFIFSIFFLINFESEHGDSTSFSGNEIKKQFTGEIKSKKIDQLLKLKLWHMLKPDLIDYVEERGLLIVGNQTKTQIMDDFLKLELGKMLKKDLINYSNEQDITVNSKTNKAQIIGNLMHLSHHRRHPLYKKRLIVNRK